MTVNFAPFSRRLVLAAGLAKALSPAYAQTKNDARAQTELRFPRDLGSHPDFAIEWWYVTGHVLSGNSPNQRQFGFQITFFRSKVESTQTLQSAFAAKQLIFAHAAVTDVGGKKMLQDQRIARQGFEVAQASEKDTSIVLRDWSLQRNDGQYHAIATSDQFDFDFVLNQTQPMLLQGKQGVSRKGPDEKQVSFYYSLPQLNVTGTLRLGPQRLAVQGTAWLDHEWSHELLHPQAVGWDWIGMNLFDGSALTAFRLRDATGNALWDGGSFRHPSMDAASGPYIFSRGEVQFQALRGWTSASTRARYPVEWLVRTPADFYTVKAVIDNQELNSRSSSGTIYWEGLSELFDSNGNLVGRGYLEMTGYAAPLRLLT